MTNQRVLLDTDILSAIMRKQPQAVSKAQAYLSIHQHFTFSVITRYEIMRGLKAKNATTQLRAFEAFCDVNVIIPLTDIIIVHAADIYADLHQRGKLIGDADILIAASAVAHDYTLVTNNESHYQRIMGLTIENWLHQA